MPETQEHYLKVVLNAALDMIIALSAFKKDGSTQHLYVAQAHCNTISTQLSSRPGIISEVGRGIVKTFEKRFSKDFRMDDFTVIYLLGALSTYVALVDHQYYRS